MSGWKWWEQYGAGVPELQAVAVKVLAQCSPACSCERNWSTYGFIHCKSRNRLGVERAKDLVYVFSILRLLLRLRAVNYQELVAHWGASPSDEEE